MEADDGEWMQPIRTNNGTENARHVAAVAESTMGRKSRASVSVDREDGIRWDDMVSQLDQMRLSDLNVEVTMNSFFFVPFFFFVYLIICPPPSSLIPHPLR